jgi:hypothetical protein
LQLNFPGNSPYEAGELASDGGYHFGFHFSLGHKPTEPAAESNLGFPGNIPDGLRQSLLSFEQKPAYPGRLAIGVGRFNENAPDVAIAGFGDAAPFDGLTAGVFRGNQTQIGHELPGILKTSYIADLRDGGYSHRRSHPSEGLEGFNHWGQAPLGQQLQTLVD